MEGYYDVLVTGFSAYDRINKIGSLNKHFIIDVEASIIKLQAQIVEHLLRGWDLWFDPQPGHAKG